MSFKRKIDDLKYFSCIKEIGRPFSILDRITTEFEKLKGARFISFLEKEGEGPEEQWYINDEDAFNYIEKRLADMCEFRYEREIKC